MAANGNPPQRLRRDPHFDAIAGRSAAYGCYAALEMAGFGFLHPLAPSLPDAFDFAAVVDTVVQAPRWRLRGWHVHTEHPIELNDLLTGFDVTVNGTVLETWESMLPDWENFLQWCLAQGLNRCVAGAVGRGLRAVAALVPSLAALSLNLLCLVSFFFRTPASVEWLTLMAKDWEAYAFSKERQQRFLNLTNTARSYGLHAGRSRRRGCRFCETRVGGKQIVAAGNDASHDRVPARRFPAVQASTRPSPRSSSMA